MRIALDLLCKGVEQHRLSRSVPANNQIKAGVKPKVVGVEEATVVLKASETDMHLGSPIDVAMRRILVRGTEPHVDLCPVEWKRPA